MGKGRVLCYNLTLELLDTDLKTTQSKIKTSIIPEFWIEVIIFSKIGTLKHNDFPLDVGVVIITSFPFL